MVRAGRRRKSSLSSSDRGVLSSVARTLSLLDYLCSCGCAGVSDISRALHGTKSTVFRMLATLEKHGFVSQCSRSGLYCIGGKVFQIARNAARSMRKDIGRISSSLRRIADATGENAIFAAIDPSMTDAVVIHEELSANPVIARPMHFERFSLLDCPAGILYLASLPPSDAKDILTTILGRRKGRKADSSLMDKTLALVAECRRKSYALSRRGKSGEISILGVYVPQSSAGFHGALMISGPTSRNTPSSVRKWSAILLREAAALK